jgi:hypothetical protein
VELGMPGARAAHREEKRSDEPESETPRPA